MDPRAMEIASQLCEYLIKKTHNSDSFRGPPPFDDFAYGAAVSDWEKKNKPDRAWFSTEDPHLLYYRGELSLHFGLPIITREEANQRAELLATKVVTEATWLEELGIINPFEEKKDDRE